MQVTYMYNSTRKREGGKRKDQGRAEISEKEKEKGKNQAGKTNDTFYEFSFTPLRFSFYTFLCGHLTWSHTCMQFLTFLCHSLKIFSASLYELLPVLVSSSANYWHPEPSLSPNQPCGLHSIIMCSAKAEASTSPLCTAEGFYYPRD